MTVSGGAPTKEPTDARRALYCVLCGADATGRNGVQVCPKSELRLSHLWAPVGHVEPWFKVKRGVSP